MFRPIRMLFVIFFAFVAGIFFERASQSETCLDRGGAISEGLCVGVDE